jgi:hypothetical protein
MSAVIRSFRTEAEARAFAAGVEYVNDSALRVTRIYNAVQEPGRALAQPGAPTSSSHPWWVALEDRDAEPEAPDAGARK